MSTIEPFDLCSNVPLFTASPARCQAWDAYVLENFYNIEAKKESIRQLENIAERDAFTHLSQTTDLAQEDNSLRILTLLEMQKVNNVGNGSFLYRKIFDACPNSIVVQDRLRRVLEHVSDALLIKFMYASDDEYAHLNQTSDIAAKTLIESLSNGSIVIILRELQRAFFKYPDQSKKFDPIVRWMLDSKMLLKMVDGWHASLELQYGPIISLLNSYINTETDEKISAYNKSRLACIDDELDRLNTDKHEYYATILSILHGAIASESFENRDTVANNLLTLVTTHLQEKHQEMYKSYKVAIDLGLPMGHKNLCQMLINKKISIVDNCLPEV